MKQRDLYSIEEARERLGGISRNSIYQLLRKGQLASVIIGSRRLVSAAAIAQLIANSTTTTSPKDAAVRVPSAIQAEIRPGSIAIARFTTDDRMTIGRV